MFQGDQPSSGVEAGRGDSDHVSQADRKHRPDLLRLLHHLWHPRGAGSYRSTQTPVILFVLVKMRHLAAACVFVASGSCL